mmetsp:Transcript_131121/g.184920  ORF Transcript_131121/g.184920 Transcript_131121/m.184920 type:complete len:226 (+) Transcript_131121:465-1142(+)
MPCRTRTPEKAWPALPATSACSAARCNAALVPSCACTVTFPALSAASCSDLIVSSTCATFDIASSCLWLSAPAVWTASLSCPAKEAICSSVAAIWFDASVEASSSCTCSAACLAARAVSAESASTCFAFPSALSTADSTFDDSTLSAATFAASSSTWPRRASIMAWSPLDAAFRSSCAACFMSSSMSLSTSSVFARRCSAADSSPESSWASCLMSSTSSRVSSRA